MSSLRYGPDVLSGPKRGQRPELPKVQAELGLVVEDSAGEFCGAVVGWEKDAVALEDRHGKRRMFPWGPAPFLLEGQPVILVKPVQPGSSSGQSARTASGSIAAPTSRAKVAKASRIYVEGPARRRAGGAHLGR